MADKWGGYRQPTNPAPVSGPGMLSKRTDGGAIDGMIPAANRQPQRYMPDLGYGKGKEMMEQQAGAPMQGTPTPSMPAPQVRPISLSTPTLRPNEPITTGVDIGPGAGSEAIRMPNIAMSPSHTVKQIALNDPTGEAELLYRTLLDKGM